MKNSKLCLVLNGNTLSRNIELLEENKDYIDLVEMRADYLDQTEWSSLDRFPRFLNRPAILTVRRSADGGLFTGTEAERGGLLRRAARGDWACVDLESDFTDHELATELHQRRVRVIRSFHDFSGVPADLVQRVRQVAPRELPKAAVTPQSTADLFRLLEACFQLRHREKIILGMGEYAVATRILSAKIGSALSYCSLPPEQGRLDPELMFSVYRFREITRRTRLFGVIGKPIAHSLSPHIHNKAFRDLDLDAVYVPFLVDDLPAFLKIARLLGLEGFSVTLPHKSAILPFLKDADGLCRTVGLFMDTIPMSRVSSNRSSNTFPGSGSPRSRPPSSAPGARRAPWSTRSRPPAPNSSSSTARRPKRPHSQASSAPRPAHSTGKVCGLWPGLRT
jgi:3-dehydroquinate dehydratase/shikimate dehydrogenase